MRIPARPEPRGRKGVRDHRADQRDARKPVRLYTGQADPLLADRAGRAHRRHDDRLARLRARSRWVARQHLPCCRAFHPGHVGIRGDRGQLLVEHAADHVRDVLLRDDLHSYERTAHPDSVHAPMGAANHLRPAAPLFHRYHAGRLSQGSDRRQHVALLRRPRRLRHRIQCDGRPDLPQTVLTAA